jgi:putative hydrolase of the HAD superfamily
LWSAVPDGLVEALAAFRSAGGKVAIVSNSEGMLDALFTRLGLRASFDVVADSGVLGVEKPDPRIFEHVLRACDTPPERALHLGDIFATDVLGARAAGIRHALIDPHGHYEGRHLEVPRVPDVARTCHAILAARA